MPLTNYIIYFCPKEAIDQYTIASHVRMHTIYSIWCGTRMEILGSIVWSHDLSCKIKSPMPYSLVVVQWLQDTFVG